MVYRIPKPLHSIYSGNHGRHAGRRRNGVEGGRTQDTRCATNAKPAGGDEMDAQQFGR